MKRVKTIAATNGYGDIEIKVTVKNTSCLMTHEVDRAVAHLASRAMESITCVPHLSQPLSAVLVR